ncbi:MULTISPECIES: hypothetical protein [unclassified Streptomyces]|uniref:hypothetical protein n=1 Tax=unclassified Streptomyces TaxID=2593676 RepID=UPI0036F4FB25
MTHQHNRTTDEELTRKAVQAYVRLMATLQAAIEDPDRSNEALSVATREAHHAMNAAGLLQLREPQMAELVAKYVPEFKWFR